MITRRSNLVVVGAERQGRDRHGDGVALRHVDGGGLVQEGAPVFLDLDPVVFGLLVDPLLDDGNLFRRQGVLLVGHPGFAIGMDQLDQVAVLGVPRGHIVAGLAPFGQTFERGHVVLGFRLPRVVAGDAVPHQNRRHVLHEADRGGRRLGGCPRIIAPGGRDGRCRDRRGGQEQTKTGHGEGSPGGRTKKKFYILMILNCRGRSTWPPSPPGPSVERRNLSC